MTLIQGGTSSTALQLQVGTGGTLSVGNGGLANTVQIGNITGAVSQTINVGTNATGSGTNVVHIGDANTATDTVTIGSSSNTASTLTLEAGTGTTALFNGATAHAIQLATGAAAQTITIGSTNTSSSLTLQAGTGSIKANGNVIANGSATATTATTSGTGSNTTTLTFTGTTSFANNDVVFIDNAGQDFYTRIVSGANAASVTVSPAVSFDNAVTVTKYNIQNIGATATDYTTQANRFFQGYFLGGVVTGAGSTTLSDQMLQSTGNLNLTGGSSGVLTLQSGATGDIQFFNSSYKLSSAGVLTVASVNSASTTITAQSTDAFDVGRQGTTNPALQVDTNAANSVTGLKITAAAAGGGLALSTISSGSNESLTIDAKGTGTLTLQPAATGDIQFFSSSNKITSAGALTLAATITANTTNTINGISINSGAVSGVTGITMASGNFLQTGSGTFDTGSGAVSLNGDTTIASGKNFTQSGTGTFSTGTGTVSLNGNTDVANNKSLATKAGTTYTTAGSANDVAISTASLYILDTSGAAQTITGIVAGRDGQQLTLVNGDASAAVTLTNEDAASSANNRITTGTGASITIPAGSSASLVYDATNNRWRVVGGVAGGTGTCPTCANQQLSNLSGTVAVNLALNPAGDNTLDLGSSANSWRSLYADTSVLTPLLDNAGATLTVGSAATGVDICKTATCDTISIGTGGDADTITIGDSSDTTSLNGSTIGINGTVTVLGATNINNSGSAATSIATGTGTLGLGNTTGATTLTGASGSSSIGFGNFTVSTAGAIVGVGVNSGSGLLQGTGGLTLTGTTSINASTNSATNINTGTSNTQVSIGGGSGTFSLDTTNIDISNTGAITGATGLTLASGNILATSSATGTTGTSSGAGNSNTTTVILASAGSFANNDVIFVDNTGGDGQDFYTRIVSGAGSTTLTVSPAVSYGTNAGYTGDATITKYNIQNIGATASDYTTQANRFFQGYFLGGVVTGAGSTTLSDRLLQSSGNLNLTGGGTGLLTLQSGATGDIQFFGSSNKITSAGALTLASTITANTTNTINGVSINTGAITAATSNTINGVSINTGAITAATTNTINGININSGAVSGVTTLATGATTVTSSSATALAVGLNGTTNSAFNVDASTASSATGLQIKSAAAGGGLAIATTSSGTDEALTISAKGVGTVTLASGSTGDVQFFSASNKITSAGALTIAGALTSVGVASGSGQITGTGGINVSGSATLAATAGNTVNIGNTSGALTVNSGGTSSITNTSGNLTITTATSGNTIIDSAGALQLGITNSTSTSLGKTGTTLTINPTAWTATPTISGLITASGGLTTTGTVLANTFDRSTAGQLSIGTGGASNATSIVQGSSSVTSMTFTTDNNAANDFTFTGGITGASSLTIQGTTFNIGNGSAATISTPSGNANLGIQPNGSGALNLATTNTGNVTIGNTTGTVTLQGATTVANTNLYQTIATPAFSGGADATGTNTGSSGTGNVTFNGVATYGKYLYATNQGDGSVTACSSTASAAAAHCELQVYDVSNPASPVYLNGIDSTGTVNGGTGTIGDKAVAISGHFLYVARVGSSSAACSSTIGTNAQYCELQIYDIGSNPARPLYIAGVDSDGTVNGGSTAVDFNSISISGKYAFIASAGNAINCSAATATGCELKDFDVSNPYNPTYIGGGDAGGTGNSGSDSGAI